jgi:glycosyltransferase involved in cell wall biosynthesis
MSIPVSILICTRNRAKALRDTLQSVGTLDIPPSLSPELVVVDNGSTDATQAVLSNPPVSNMSIRSVGEPTPGVARARNTAIEEAEGRILLWLDDDVHVPPDWMRQMVRPILSEKADAVTGKVVLAPHLQRSWMKKFHRTALASTESIDPEAPKNLMSGNMAFSRTVLEKVPGFDPELGPGSRMGALEDTLFSWQLREAGYRFHMVSTSAVEHHFDEKRLTRKSFIRSAIARGRSLSYIRYHWSHHQESDWTHRSRSYELWRNPWIVLVKRFFERRFWQGRHWTVGQSPVIDEQEFWTIMNLYSLRQYLFERRGPRNYRERGMEKIRGEKSPLQVHT